MKKKSYFINLSLFILIILFSISLINAVSMNNANIQLVFKSGNIIQLSQNCLNSTYSNISRIIYPNGTFALNTQTLMTKNGDDYSYSFSDTNTIGQYLVYGVCDESGTKTNWVYDFTITKSGDSLTTGSSIIYSILNVFIFVLFLLGLYFSVTIPYKNNVNQDGYVIKITKLKYVKIGIIMITYLMFVWNLNILISISDNYAFLTQYYGLVSFLFNVLNKLAFPLFVFFVVLSIFEIIKDADLGKQINQLGRSFT